MKDSKEYSKRIQKLYRSLRRTRQKRQKPEYVEPVDAVIYAVLSENLTEPHARTAIKKFADYFVDSNDLRVALAEEVVEVLAEDTTATRNIAATLTRILGAIFEKYNAVTLQALRKIGKRPAKQLLEKFDGTTPFIVDYCMLTALQGHAIPLTHNMIDLLKTDELVHPDADRREIEGFLARQISAKNAFEFYSLLRHQSETSDKGKKKKTTLETKTKKTTGKKLKK